MGDCGWRRGAGNVCSLHPSCCVAGDYGCPRDGSELGSGGCACGGYKALVVSHLGTHICKELPRQIHTLHGRRGMLESTGIHEEIVGQDSGLYLMLSHIGDPWL